MSLLFIWFIGFASEFVFLWIEWYQKGAYKTLASVHSRDPNMSLLLGLTTLAAFTFESVFWFISMPWKMIRYYRNGKDDG